MQKRILWSVAALCATVLLAAGPLEAKGGGGAGGANGTATAGGSGDVGGGGNANLNTNANSNNKKGNGNANGNANGGGNGTNGSSDAEATSETTATAINKGGKAKVVVVSTGNAQAGGTQGNNNAQAGGGTTLKAKAVGGTSKPRGVTTSDTTGMAVRDGKIKVLDGTLVYVDNKGKVTGKVACDSGNCSGAISTPNGVKVFTFHADEDWDVQGNGLFAGVKTAGGVIAAANRNGAHGRGSFFAGAIAGGSNSNAGAAVRTGAFARVQLGNGPKTVSVTRSAESKCRSNPFLENNVQCQIRTR